MDIMEDLNDLIKQATEERSHYYVKSVAERARAEIATLRQELWIANEMKRAAQDNADRLAGIIT